MSLFDLHRGLSITVIYSGERPVSPPSSK